MNLKQAIAGAAIGCALGVVGIGASSGVANAAPQCPPTPGAQCGPGGPGPGGPPGGGQHHGGLPAVARPPGQPQGDPRGQGGPPGGQGGPPGGQPHQTSADKVMDPAVNHPTSTDKVAAKTSADKVADPVATSTVPAATTGGHRGIPRTTTGADVSRARRGVTTFRLGAGARRHRRCGMDRCLPPGARRLRRSTTSVTTSNRYGTPATTSGASISSESGFRSPSDLQLEERPSRVARDGRSQFT